MSNSPASTAIESVAQKYRQRGYEVTLDPSPTVLPAQVRQYRPDFIATRGDEHVAVEVKGRSSLVADPQLTRLAERFCQVPGWRLDVAIVDEADTPMPTPVLSFDEAKNRMAAADRIATENQDYAAALLLLWTAIEAILHSRMRHEDEDRPVTPAGLAKPTYSLGIIDENEVPFVEWLVGVRNDVVHGRKTPVLSLASYQEVRDFVSKLLSSTNDEFQSGNRP